MIKTLNKAYKLWREDPEKLKQGIRYISQIKASQFLRLPNNIHYGKYFQSKKASYRIAHVGYQDPNNNAGDTLLFEAIRYFFQQQLGSVQLSLIDIRETVTEQMIAAINQQDALVIGGGGLFLKDTNPNNKSGWQWACPTDLLQKINIPVVIYAVGYNRFRGQDDFDDVFRENIKVLAEKSVFFGLRNAGSIQSVKPYLPEYLHHKLQFQPCLTTVLNRYYHPGLECQVPKNEQKTMSINIAFDRAGLRFGDREEYIRQSLFSAIKEVQSRGWKVIFFVHSMIDNNIKKWLEKEPLDVVVKDIDYFTSVPIIQEYLNVDLALGMRGHSQMVPFGLDVPIFSLISHNKLRYFLDDIGHTDWGADITDSDFGEQIVRFVDNFDANKLKKEIKDAQSILWQQSLNNFTLIKKAIDSYKESV